VWKREGDSYVLACRPISLPDDLGYRSTDYVEGKTWSIYLIKPITGSNNKQCEVEFSTKVNTGLWLLAKVANSLMAKNLQLVTTLRNAFSRDGDIDARERERLIASGVLNSGNGRSSSSSSSGSSSRASASNVDANNISTTTASITADEDALVERVRDMFERNSDLNLNYMKSLDAKVKMKVGFSKGDKHAI
jgi:hypothetical protein